MQPGTKVQVMGIHRTIPIYGTRTVERDGESVEEEYVVRRDDGPREGREGVIVVPHVEQRRALDAEGNLILEERDTDLSAVKILRREGNSAVVLIPNPEPAGRVSVLIDATVLHVDEADVEEVV